MPPLRGGALLVSISILLVAFHFNYKGSVAAAAAL